MMDELKLDDLVDITIKGARVMYTTKDNSSGADTLTVLATGGTKYVLQAAPGLVKITKVAEPEQAEETRVSDERVQEILDGLNGFIVHEYEPVSDLVDGRAVHSREIVGSDFNLDKAVDWALEQREVSIACGPDTDGSAEVELDDGTIIVWQPSERAWAVTVSDDTDGEVAR